MPASVSKPERNVGPNDLWHHTSLNWKNMKQYSLSLLGYFQCVMPSFRNSFSCINFRYIVEIAHSTAHPLNREISSSLISAPLPSPSLPPLLLFLLRLLL